MAIQRPRPVLAADARVITIGCGPEPTGVRAPLGHPTEPAVVQLILTAPESIVILSEGNGHLGSGGMFWLDEILTGSAALQERWVSVFERAGALWIVPVLARLAAGDIVTEESIVTAYRGHHGAYPTVTVGRFD